MITPRETVNLAGYPGRNSYKLSFLLKRKSRGVHDELYARCLALSDGKTTLAMTCLDLIAYYNEDVKIIREKVYRRRNDYSPENLHILVGSQHTHAGPDTYGVFGGVPRRYKDLVNEQAAAAICDALDRLRPARLGFTSVAAEPGTFASLRGPDSVYADHEVTCMFVKCAQSGEHIATVVNFGCHPNVLWADNYLISADFPGYMCAYLDRELGGMSIYFNAAVGDVYFDHIARDFFNTERRGRTYAEAERLGHAMARKVMEAYGQVAEYVDAGELRVAPRTVEIPVENRLLKVLRALGVLRRPMRRGRVVTEIWCIDIRELKIVTVPAQIFSSLGREIKEALGAKYTMLFGITNDENGYVVPPGDFVPGGRQERISLGPRTWLYLKQAILNCR